MSANFPARLLARLDAIGVHLATTSTALALLGLGSVGSETARLDDYSDLDFFVIVQPGTKQHYLADLDWLAAPHPLAYSFLNTVDGYKALYDDGIFCEFAVFEPDELRNIPYTGERIIWAAEGFSLGAIAAPPRQQSARSTEWLLGEAITNLYVGLGRLRRGEVLSATRFIQGYAVDRLVELAVHIEAPAPSLVDPFTAERRFEQRQPGVAAHLASFVQGYERNAESALALITYLDAHFPVNPAMKAAIVRLCNGE